MTKKDTALGGLLNLFPTSVPCSQALDSGSNARVRRTLVEGFIGTLSPDALSCYGRLRD